MINKPAKLVCADQTLSFIFTEVAEKPGNAPSDVQDVVAAPRTTIIQLRHMDPRSQQGNAHSFLVILLSNLYAINNPDCIGCCFVSGPCYTIENKESDY